MKEEVVKKLLGIFSGDRRLAEEAYAEYARSVDALRAAYAEALESGDFGGAMRAAHTARGDAMLAGDDELKEIAEKMQLAAVEKDGWTARKLHGAFCAALERRRAEEAEGDGG